MVASRIHMGQHYQVQWGRSMPAVDMAEKLLGLSHLTCYDVVVNERKEAKVIRVAMLGWGVVGQGVAELLQTNGSHIEQRLGARLELVGALVKDPTKNRLHVGDVRLTTDFEELLSNDVHMVVEVMGGLEPAGTYIAACLKKCLPVVTANKALLAEQAEQIFTLAEEQKTDLYYEAAVCGAIPIIRLIREAYASDCITSLFGVVNGTSNYVLSRMTEEGLAFDDALRFAQQAGFAEADPTLDINGGDAGHKLTILAMLAFGKHVSFRNVNCEGIDSVTALDIQMASRMGYVIKPLAVAALGERDESTLDLRVHPALVLKDSPLGNIHGATNAVHIRGKSAGPSMISGEGAGALPTATSVVADMVDVARNLAHKTRNRIPTRGHLPQHLTPAKTMPAEEQVSRFYVRVEVKDHPGALSAIAGALADQSVSIEQLHQDGVGDPTTPVHVVVLTQRVKKSNLDRALESIAAQDHIAAPPKALRVEATMD